MGTMVGLLLVYLLLAAVLGSVKGTAEVMAHVTAHFGKFLDECREEAGLSEELMEEFHHFWREEFAVVHRELGCAMICMRGKLQLQHDDANINQEKLHEYIMGFPQGETLAAKMVELIHNCEKQHKDFSDNCGRVVKVAACFKGKAKEASIVPEVAMIEAVLEKY